MQIQLETRDGGFVATKEIPLFQLLPESVLWGSRHFGLYSSLPHQGPVYREILCYAIVDIQPMKEPETKQAHDPLRSSLTTDRTDPALRNIEPSGQQEKYLVLSPEELAKGFVRPVRNKYIHLKCGVVTSMGNTLSETYARDPQFYDGTFCCGCKAHFPLVIDGERQFKWDGPEGGFVGE